MHLVGYANGNKYYYDSTKSGGATIEVPQDENVAGVAENIKYNSLDEELASYGFTASQIQSINEKIKNVDNFKKSVPSTKENPNGTLLSNMALSVKNNTEYQQAKIDIEKSKLTSMSASNEIQRQQLNMMDYQLLMNSQILEELQNLTTTLKNQTLTTGEIKVNPSVHVDTSKISESTKVIADSIEALASSAKSQKLVNDKQSEKLDIELNKDINFDGKTYNKIELDKIKSKEQLTNVKDENDTLLNDGLELVEEFLTDGFDLEVNPFVLMMNALKENFVADSKNIQVKYNLKSEEI